MLLKKRHKSETCKVTLVKRYSTYSNYGIESGRQNQMLKEIFFFLPLRLGLQRYLHSSRWEMWRKCADIDFIKDWPDIFSKKKTYLKVLCKLKEKSCSRHLTCNCMPKVDLRYVCQEYLIVLAMWCHSWSRQLLKQVMRTLSPRNPTRTLVGVPCLYLPL